MPFRISALPARDFAGLLALPDAELAARGGVRRVGEVGETVVLVNHEHLPAPGPYRAAHAIFVCEGVEEARPAVGGGARAVIERLLADPEVAFVHLHYAKPGCYAARADRA